MTTTTFTPGTVVRYKSERPNNWCREGMALADERGRLVDTYWESTGEEHHLSEVEIATVEVLFNVCDFMELPRHSEYTWPDYHPDDRQVITSQHGLRRRLLVRHGARPDLPTRIENAREAVREAEEAVASAESSLRWRREDLARLIDGQPEARS
jgi:hypothetical protein